MHKPIILHKSCKKLNFHERVLGGSSQLVSGWQHPFISHFGYLEGVSQPDPYGTYYDHHDYEPRISKSWYDPPSKTFRLQKTVAKESKTYRFGSVSQTR